MKKRRHHNNKGNRQMKRGNTRHLINRLRKQLGIPREGKSRNCDICNDELWVCENHDCIPWEDCGCGGAGMPCVCNPEGLLPSGFTVWASV